MWTPVIALINQKGGCGKSTGCLNVAGHFAKSGYQVLIVDADPQGSLTQGLFGPEFMEGLRKEQTLAVLFDDEVMAPPAKSLVLQSPIEGIKIAPANSMLNAVNKPEPEKSGSLQFVLTEFLAEVGEAFDLILIDCPPNLYQCSWNSLLAADFVIIPVPPEDFGSQGIRAVLQAIEHAKTLKPELALLGMLISKFDQRLLLQRQYEANLRGQYGALVFQSVFPEASAFKVAVACREPVTHYAPRSAAAEATAKLGDEILDRMETEYESQGRAAQDVH